jgi:hypothetical protein
LVDRTGWDGAGASATVRHGALAGEACTAENQVPAAAALSVADHTANAPFLMSGELQKGHIPPALLPQLPVDPDEHRTCKGL